MTNCVSLSGTCQSIEIHGISEPLYTDLQKCVFFFGFNKFLISMNNVGRWWKIYVRVLHMWSVFMCYILLFVIFIFVLTQKHFHVSKWLNSKKEIINRSSHVKRWAKRKYQWKLSHLRVYKTKISFSNTISIS